jgi:dolichol-phosphate mannosyltransferase
MAGGHREGYPALKLIVNRIVNTGIRLIFGHGYNDTTNAFKAYRREVIDNIQPLISPHFNLTVEMPLKAVVRGHSYAIIPISWTHRRVGESKLSLEEMGGRYLFIILYVFFEHHLSRGDYRRAPMLQRPGHHVWRAGAPGMIAHRDAATPSVIQSEQSQSRQASADEPAPAES